MKQIGSVTTTSPGAAGSAIGTPLGELGSGTPENLRMAAWLAGQQPADVDRAAHSRASQHGVELVVRSEGRYPENAPAYQVAVSCNAYGDDASRASALADVHRLTTPAPSRDVEGWLAELSVMVARRASEPMDEALRLEVYASRLRAYPADVARSAVLGKRWQFWPTWAELAGECDRLSAPRRHMVAALSAPAETPDAPRKRPVGELERMREMAAGFMAEMEAADRAKQPPRVPHWSETANATNPLFTETLRRARADNALARAHSEDAA